jgi:Protein of unknown function DUF262
VRTEGITVLFESPPLSLRELLDDVHTGKIQLPDFQRAWVWDDEHIVSLLATVTLGYPLGVIMTLRTGGSSRFKPRPLAGTPAEPLAEPSELLMDGQQRMTSLYQALRSGNSTETEDKRQKKLARWYYLDIEAALNPITDRESAIWSVPQDRKVTDSRTRAMTHDLGTLENECASGLFPLRLAFDPVATNTWQRGYVSSGDDSRWDRWGVFQSTVLANITGYQLPVIRLANETPKEAVCTVFEKVNTGGVPLNVFELLTATYAAGDGEYFAKHGRDFELPRHWKQVREDLAGTVLAELEVTAFLQAVCLMSTHNRRRGHPDVDPFTSRPRAVSVATYSTCRSRNTCIGHRKSSTRCTGRRGSLTGREYSGQKISPTRDRSPRSPRLRPRWATRRTQPTRRTRSPGGTGAAFSASSTADRPSRGSRATWSRWWPGCAVDASRRRSPRQASRRPG